MSDSKFQEEMMQAYLQQAAVIKPLEEKVQQLSNQPTVINNTSNKSSFKPVKSNTFYANDRA